MKNESTVIEKERSFPMPVDYWISAETLSPEDVGLDWVQVQTMMLPECYWGIPETAEKRDGKWFTMDDVPLEDNETVLVTHWRLLPAPPNRMDEESITERRRIHERSGQP